MANSPSSGAVARDERPNILLLMTDQQRGDALGYAGHPVLETPNLDNLAAEGYYFNRAFSASPVCIPARRTLMTGTKASTHGVFMNYGTRLDLPTLPGELARAGYQTHLVGKLHLHPVRKLYGFDSADWSDRPGPLSPGQALDDYQQFLVERGVPGTNPGMAHGVNLNGWNFRAFHLDEQFHFTNWCAEYALRFLERRDPTAPFFLKVSFHAPHQPCVPPQYYWDKYMARDIPEPKVGEWARVFDKPVRGLRPDAWRVFLVPQVQKQYMAGYYGAINQIDEQIGRILGRIPPNTLVLFTSDHGEMLGQHQWIRKRTAFEGSAHIPMIIRMPRTPGAGDRPPDAPRVGRDIGEVVELMDVMPTILSAAGVDVPDGVDGRSLLPLIEGTGTDWRSYIHGECSRIPTAGSGMQFITDGHAKYIYYPATGAEQFFDLDSDPDEMVDFAGDPSRVDQVAAMRVRLAEELRERPEGFVKDGNLVATGGITPDCLPEYQRET